MSTLQNVVIDDLYQGALTTTPVEHDWSSDDVDDVHTWEAFTYDDYTLVADDSTTAAIVIDGVCHDLSDYDGYLASIDVEDEDDAPIDRDTFERLAEVEPVMYGAEGPMMNYYYPLDITWNTTPQQAAAALAHLPLCVVQVDETYALALTGGGMDLSWEVCEGFIRLGYLPPTHFAMLPAMAGRGTRDQDRVIVAACKRSFEASAKRAQRDLDTLNERFPS